MKIILSAVAIVALLAGPCYAQVNITNEKTGEWSRRVEEGKRLERNENKKKLDADFKAASDKIPEPKVKFDPWKNAR
ncbi:MAG: hypothetical protein WCD75_13105 [Rhodoplanes sp.]